VEVAVAGKGRKRDRPRPWQVSGARPEPDVLAVRGRECGSKVAHANRVAAEQAALEHERDHGASKDAYLCRWCGRWHVGTSRDRA
jgi:hypothetical protein